ncbi:hypothetical protein TSUD_236040 [Trifolium subterraneum]|nr:hypothetical protein TSUD_236040 [Trifolium subterraneum]
MASQLVNDVRCQTLMHCAASYGERGSKKTLSRRKSYRYNRIENSIIYPEDHGNFNKDNNNKGGSLDQKGAKHSKNLTQAQKLHRLGFSYLATSFLYIVIKVKAFYNGFLGDVASESRMMGIEAPMAEPYFSVPVIPN